MTRERLVLFQNLGKGSLLQDRLRRGVLDHMMRLVAADRLRGRMPAKLTDAMAMGKIIIASALSDIPKYLDGCGLLVPPDDEAAITEKLVWISSNRAAAEALGRKARDRFLRDMTYDTMRATMTPVIEDLLRKPH